ERDDLAVERAGHASEGDQGEIHGVEHQLDAHEDDDGVAARQDTDSADREEDRRQVEVVVDAHRSSSFTVSSACGTAADTWRCSGTLRAAMLPSGSSAG